MQRWGHLWAHSFANGIVRAEEQYVVCVEVGCLPIVVCPWRVLVELVGGIAIVVEIGKGYGTLLALPDFEIIDGNAVFLQEGLRGQSYAVMSRIADETAGKSCTSDGDNAVETAAAGHRCHGTVVLEEYVHDGFTHRCYHAHNGLVCCKSTELF